MNCVLKSWTDYETELRGYLLRQLGDASLVDDLLQEVFTRAVAHGSGFCQLQNPRAWLFTVARNQLADVFRRHQGFVELEDISEPEETLDAVAGLSACLPRALQDLPEADREVITCCDLEGMSQVDYARAKNLSLPGAKSRIQRARKRLKQRLYNNCQVQFDDSGKICCFAPRQKKTAKS